MTMRRIVNTLEGLAVSKDPQSIRNDQSAGVRQGVAFADQQSTFMKKGQVLAIASADVSILIDGASTTAVMATDEPLQVGQSVWAIRADDGTWVLLGSVK